MTKTALEFTSLHVTDLHEWIVSDHAGRWGRSQLLGRAVLAHGAIGFGTPLYSLCCAIYDVANCLFSLAHARFKVSLSFAKSFTLIIISAPLVSLAALGSYILMLPFYCADLAVTTLFCAVNRHLPLLDTANAFLTNNLLLLLKITISVEKQLFSAL